MEQGQMDDELGIDMANMADYDLAEAVMPPPFGT